MRVFLVGPMGAGKTTIGKRLAKALKKSFVDTDHELETRTGASIPTIFEMEGEEGFRNREVAVIDDLSQRNDIILSTGGGAILRKENRTVFNTRGTTVFLNTSVQQQLRRAGKDSNRPLLQTPDPAATLQALWNIRLPLYESVADLTVLTDHRPVTSVTEEILQHLMR